VSKLYVERQAVLDVFPGRGTAVIGYFVDRDETSGYLYVGLVDQCGRKQYRLRWSDWSTETFMSLSGNTRAYQYFRILGYVGLEDYQRLCSEWIPDFQAAPAILDEPCARTIAAYKRQRIGIAQFQSQYEAERAAIPSDLSSGQAITFIYSPCLETPRTVTGKYSRVFDGYLYANCDQNLQATKNEDECIYIPRHLLLKVGR